MTQTAQLDQSNQGSVTISNKAIAASFQEKMKTATNPIEHEQYLANIVFTKAYGAGASFRTEAGLDKFRNSAKLATHYLSEDIFRKPNKYPNVEAVAERLLGVKLFF